MWDTVKCTITNNKSINEEQKEKEAEKIFEEIITKYWKD